MKILISALALIGCVSLAIGGNTLPAPQNNQTRYDVIVVEGHHYLVVATKIEQGYRGGYWKDGYRYEPAFSSATSLQVLHSHGCPCMTNNIQKVEILTNNVQKVEICITTNALVKTSN